MRAAELDRAAHGVDHGVLIAQVVYVVLVCAWCAVHGLPPTPPLLIIVFFAAFVWRAKYRALLWDFAPFFMLVLGYIALKGVAPSIALSRIHVTDMIVWERRLFGGVLPTEFLQRHLSDRPYTAALDAVANALYLSHFIVPAIVGLVFWQCRRRAYWGFITGLAALSYAGFLSFIVFPAAPPWWAAHFGYLPPGTITLDHFMLSKDSMLAGPNPVAAMPSLHAAWPTYIALYCMWIWGRRAAWLLLLPVGVAFSAVYLAHHYVIDVVGGVAYAGAVFRAITWWLGRRGLRP
jgi:membrane-associated phospholipid phosphatase